MFVKLCTLFSLCYFVLSSTTLDENGEIIDAAIKALATAATETVDTLSSLKLLGPKAAILIKVIVPIGEMVVQKANPKPQSDEYKALMDLGNRTELIWKNIERKIEISTRAIGAKLIMAEYERKVVLSIQNMKRLTNKYLNPTKYKDDDWISNYKRTCEFKDKAPEEILTYLKRRLVSTCEDAVTAEEAQSLTDHRAYLMRVLVRLRVQRETIPDPGDYLSEFSAIYERLGKEKEKVLNKDLDVFNRYFTSYREAVQVFFEELQVRASIEKMEKKERTCLLRDLIRTSYFNYPTIKAFVSELSNQLIELTFIAGVCADLIRHGDAQEIDKYIKRIVDDVTLISSYTSQWMNDSLISAWPSAHNQILREQIDRIIRKPGYVDTRHLKIVADLAHPLLANTGIPNYVYEMVIVRAAEEEYEHYFEGISKYCSLNKGVFGFDTVIGRIPLNSTDYQEIYEVEGRMLNMSDYAVDLNVAIQREMYELYNAANLPLIAETLKKNIDKQFISEQNFRCWVIVREWSPMPWYSCPIIDYWSSPYNYIDLNSITNLSYATTGGPSQDCEEFRFFFFL